MWLWPMGKVPSSIQRLSPAVATWLLSDFAYSLLLYLLGIPTLPILCCKRPKAASLLTNDNHSIQWEFYIRSFAYMCVCRHSLCECLVPAEAKEGVRFPGTVVTDICELLCGCWELHSDPLEEQPVLLTTKPPSPAP